MKKSLFAVLIVALLMTACGSPKTLIRVSNRADGTQTDISVSQGSGGTTSVSVTPTISQSLENVTFDVKPNTQPNN